MSKKKDKKLVGYVYGNGNWKKKLKEKQKGKRK